MTTSREGGGDRDKAATDRARDKGVGVVMIICTYNIIVLHEVHFTRHKLAVLHEHFKLRALISCKDRLKKTSSYSNKSAPKPAPYINPYGALPSASVQQ